MIDKCYKVHLLNRCRSVDRDYYDKGVANIRLRLFEIWNRLDPLLKLSYSSGVDQRDGRGNCNFMLKAVLLNSLVLIYIECNCRELDWYWYIHAVWPCVLRCTINGPEIRFGSKYTEQSKLSFCGFPAAFHSLEFDSRCRNTNYINVVLAHFMLSNAKL